MGKGVLVILVALLCGCATGPSVVPSGSMAPYADLIFDPHALDESAIQETRALEDFREGYGAAGGHKAFAQSGLGAWAWTSGRTSSEHAVRSALTKCRAYNRGHEAEFPCRLINVDGRWTGKRE